MEEIKEEEQINHFKTELNEGQVESDNLSDTCDYRDSARQQAHK